MKEFRWAFVLTDGRKVYSEWANLDEVKIDTTETLADYFTNVAEDIASWQLESRG